MSYVSYAGLIEPFSDYPLTALHGVSEGFPNVVIAEIEKNLWLFDWDDLTSRQRVELAIQHDIHHDPAMKPERTHFWTILSLIEDKEKEIAKWVAMPEPLPSEGLAKEQRLFALRGELAALEIRFNEPYPAPPVAEIATPAPKVAVGASDGDVLDQAGPEKKLQPKLGTNWRMQIQARAYEYWLRLRSSGCNPTPYSICGDMAKWCIEKNIKGGKGQNPSAGTIRNTVLCAGHWTPPHHSVEQAKEHVAQIARTAQT